MYLLVGIAIVLGIAFILFSWRLGERKKIIDQFESDVRIFLVLIVIVSFYSYFLSISAFYLDLFFDIYNIKFLLTSLYFIFPLILGVLLYVFLPWFWERTLNVRDIPAPPSVVKISRLLELTHTPQVKITSWKIPPLVYGRRKSSSTLVLPENMESFLKDEEQDAVIAHELSHINQGDVGFFTWLTLLIEGFKYWLLLYPAALYTGIMVYNLNVRNNPALILLIPLFFVSVVLLKNSLSRTRESIADAYVIFHGLEPPLKKALIKYAALQTVKKGYALNLCFYCEPRVLNPVLATHPPLTERLTALDEKKFLSETTTTLSLELALWTGIASAFLYYTVFHSFINFTVTSGLFMSDSATEVLWAAAFYAVAVTVAASYIFPTTKATVLFSDLGNAHFVGPLMKAWGLTVAAAFTTYYGLSLDISGIQPFMTAVAGGFPFWVLGFASSRPPDFSGRTGYLVCGPLLWIILLWYPVQVVSSRFAVRGTNPIPVIFFLLGVILLMLAIIIVLIEKGYIRIDKKDRIFLLFGKVKEFPGTGDITFILLAAFLLFLVPSILSFGIFCVSLLCNTAFNAVFSTAFSTEIPGIIFFYGITAIVIMYGFKKSDILFFLEISYLVDILQGEISQEECQFIHNVINKYQSPDGGYDYAGLHISNQRDTYNVIRTAHTTGIQIEPGKVYEWINSTQKEGGFSLVRGGNPRMEGVYYAVKSLLMLGFLKDVSMTVQWICDFFNGEYFEVHYDTHSVLLQTCYAVESLFLLDALHNIDTGSCAAWILNHFSEDLNPREAFFAAKSLKILGSHTDLVEKWLSKNQKVISTRLDKNLEAIYYYVKVMREYKKVIPPLVAGQAAHELRKTMKKYKRKFGLKSETKKE
jgi:Zn-dependent protease with chaperone function